MMLSELRPVYGRIDPAVSWATPGEYMFHPSNVIYAQGPISEALTEPGDSGACVFTENGDGTVGDSVVGVHGGQLLDSDFKASDYHELGDLTGTDALGGSLRDHRTGAIRH